MTPAVVPRLQKLRRVLIDTPRRHHDDEMVDESVTGA
jgi:hypothetical protein